MAVGGIAARSPRDIRALPRIRHRRGSQGIDCAPTGPKTNGCLAGRVRGVGRKGNQIFEHYRELVTEVEAKEWFALRPDEERLAVLKDA